MHGLLASVLAQLVTLALSDRLEGRYVVNDQEKYFEGINTTTPGGSLKLDWRRATLIIGYAPTLTLVPLVQTPREFLVYHRALITGQYRWRRTTLTLAESAGYGDRDFQRETLMPYPAPAVTVQTAPAQATTDQQGQKPGAIPPGGTATAGAAQGATPTPGAPTPTAPATVNPARFEGPVLYKEFRSSASLSHIVSRSLSLQLAGGYSVAGGADHDAQEKYPLSRGPDATASARYTIDARNTLTTTLTSQLSFSETGTNAFYATASEDYAHRFTRQTAGLVGAGVSFSRSEPAIGLPLYGIYPTARLGILHTERLARGTLLLSIDANTSPALDLTTATVDPRIAATLNALWARDRFSIRANANSSLSVVRGTTHTFDSVFASLTFGYNLGAGFTLDSGVRATWEKLAHQTLIDPSLVLFAGISWGVVEPLNPPRQQVAAGAH